MSGKLVITGMTLSLDVKDLSYGAGQSRFMNIKVETPEGSEGVQAEDIDHLVDLSLDMHLAMWESIQVSKYAAGEQTGKVMSTNIDTFKSRLKKCREYLATLSTEKETENGSNLG